MPQPARAWGVGVGHRGQRAPLLLANDAQRGRQVVRAAVVKDAAQGVAATLAARLAAKAARAGRCLRAFSVMNVVAAGPV